MSQFKQLPSPYSKYEVSESGSILRAIKTKSIVNVEKGTSSYRVYSDSGNGIRITLSKQKLLEIINGESETEQPTKYVGSEVAKAEKKLLIKKKEVVSSKKILKAKKQNAGVKKPKLKKEKSTLPRESSIMHKVCKMIHNGKTKEEILKSGVSPRQYTHCKYHYEQTYKKLF